MKAKSDVSIFSNAALSFCARTVVDLVEEGFRVTDRLGLSGSDEGQGGEQGESQYQFHLHSGIIAESGPSSRSRPLLTHRERRTPQWFGLSL
jgi:hypothetical protein